MANTYNICNKLQAIADAITQGGGGGGGTTVIANPSGTPTADLNTVQIGQVIYDIPGGGGGSGYSETTLWSGAPTTSSITLSDSVLNYDAIYVEGKFNNEAYMVETIDKATFTSYLGNDYISFGTHGGAYYGITPASNATHLVFFGANYNGCTRVIGLKYARGAGSDEAVDINYDNTTSGLTATNVQDAIDENADSISTLNSKLPNFEYLGSISELTPSVSISQDYKRIILTTKDSNGYLYSSKEYMRSDLASAPYIILCDYYKNTGNNMTYSICVNLSFTSNALNYQSKYVENISWDSVKVYASKN